MDFYCPAANLVIECDGSQHFTDEGLEADRMRDDALAQLGLKVFRFDNGQLVEQLDSVVEVIYQYCLNQLATESPKSPFTKGTCHEFDRGFGFVWFLPF